MSSRCLVTGGAGFIGSHLVDGLVARGDVVAVLDDLSSGSRANLPAGVELLECDVSDSATVGLISDWKPEVVAHLAARIGPVRSAADRDRDLAVNVSGTANVVDGAVQVGARRVVFASSAAVYGAADDATETDAPRPATYYGAHKYLAERYVELSGVPFAIARFANVYGPRQRNDLEGGVVSIFEECVRGGRPVTIYGSGDQTRDFVHVADVVRALLLMIDSEQSGTWNVATSVATSINELARLVGATRVEHVPARTGDVARSCLATDKISRDLGWRPRISLTFSS